MKTKIVSINEIRENDYILSAKFYTDIKPYLEQEFTFKNELTNNTDRVKFTDRVKLDLKKLTLKEKLFIYYIIKQKEKYNKIFKLIKEVT